MKDLRNIKGKKTKTHGQSIVGKITPEYRAWFQMKSRCKNPKQTGYKNYGGRGISVCERWVNSFEDFLSDIGVKPSQAHSLDRIKVNGNYEPSNCRWATREEQYSNKTNNHYVTHNGITKTIAAWSKELGVSDATIRRRLSKNQAIDSVKGHRNNKIVLDLQTGIFYESAKDAAAAKNKNVGYFWRQLNGNNKNNTSMIYV